MWINFLCAALVMAIAYLAAPILGVFLAVALACALAWAIHEVIAPNWSRITSRFQRIKSAER